MNYETLILEKKDGIAKITLNRPNRLNAVNPAMGSELHKALDDLAKDNDIKVAVITGAPRVREKEGKKEIKYTFSAGWDTTEATPVEPMPSKIIADFEKPIIAMVNGFCLGGGNEMAMACDFIFASENSEFGQPEIDLGFLPGWGGTQRLPRRVGLSTAKKMIYTGERISAKEAKEIGLADVVVPMEKLEETTMEFAKKLASKAPLAIKSIKKIMNEGIETDIESGIAKEQEAVQYLTSTEDFTEGMMARMEKRAPVWKGK